MMKKLFGLSILFFCLPGIYATEYFVSLDGSDANNGLTLSEAFRTIQKAQDMSLPGDVILVADGNYTDTNVLITRSGNPGGWITYRSVHKWGARLSSNTASTFKVAASYIVIDGFDCTAPSTYGCGVSTERGAIYHHIKILNNYCHDCGQGGVQTIDNDYITIEGNTCKKNSWLMPSCGSGISVYGAYMADTLPGYHNIVRNNICCLNDNGPATAQTDGNGIIIDDLMDTQQYHSGDARKNSYHALTLVENNLCYLNGGRGIQIFLSPNVTVRNNTVYCNNTRKDDSSWRGELNISASTHILSSNNLCVTKSGSGIFEHNRAIFVASLRRNPSSDISFNNNITFDISHPDSISVSSSGISIHVQGANGNQCAVNPLFRDEAAGDFHLKPGSPAINSGGGTFSPFDIDGVKRPKGKKPDIGCYEYSGRQKT